MFVVMNNLYLVFAVLVLGGCATKQSEKINITEVNGTEKVTFTGTRISKSEIPSGPKLKMKVSKNKGSSILGMLTQMNSLPQPMDIGDCKGLLSDLSGISLKFEIINSNLVVVQSDSGEFEYTFDDDSCPIDQI